jgi:uncharacterized protein (DUF2126 family)
VSEALLDEVRRQDRLLRERSLTIWIGAEPTFTRRESQEHWWLTEAEGGDKRERAVHLLRALARRIGAVRLLHVRGRHFPGEAAPRFCLGAHWPRQLGAAAAAAAGHSDELDGATVDAPCAHPEWAWLTMTPDPGVVEVNMAPAPDLETFLGWSRDVYAAAAEAGLSAVRYRWNGQAVDSGGGGQITLGGPTPEESPFVRHPHLLPGLLRYANRHPALSYWFAAECVGSSSQGPRPDEGVRERFEELCVALDQIGARLPRERRRGTGCPPTISAGELWRTFAPLLVDCSGNSHRAEINIEKLWNPDLPGRGCQGLVEFRALRMEPTPERMAAVGALFRAVAARLIAEPYFDPLVDWGHLLHDRFALPCFLEADLRAVLEDLDRHGFGLGAALRALVLSAPAELVQAEHMGATLTVTPALEFWPLLGDVASEERRGARVLDASTQRVQVLIKTRDKAPPGRLAACGWEVPLQRPDADRRIPGGATTGALIAQGLDAWVAGIRYRAFAPSPGLHPALRPHDPLTLVWSRGNQALQFELHGWKPGGGAYDGLPADAGEAERRRSERVVVSAAPPNRLGASETRRFEKRTSFTLDLRRLAPRYNPPDDVRS